MLTRRRVIAAVVGLPALWLGGVLALYATAYLRGGMMARVDWSRGHREIKVYGMAPASRADVAVLLQSRYGVGMNTVGGCVVSQTFIHYVRGYNDVMFERLERHYGKDILSEVSQEIELKRQGSGGGS